MAEFSRYRKPRSHNNNTISEAPEIPCIVQSTRSKPTISSILLSTFSPSNTPSDDSASASATTLACVPKKKNFSASKFRALGCTASPEVSLPAVIRASANWEAKKVKKKKKQRTKKTKLGFFPFRANLACNDNSNNSNNNINNINNNSNNNGNSGNSSSSPSSSLSLALPSSCVSVPDVWCGPGIGFTTNAASVDCVVSTRPVADRGKLDGERNNYRERLTCPVRRMVSPEDIPFMVPDVALGSRSRLDISGPRHHHGRHGYPEGLAEIVMLQSSLLMGGRPNRLDRYRGWRLDVDNMSYEELLELGDRIGYVSTGLRDDEIARCLRKTKISGGNSASRIVTEMEKKCSICQEEYEAGDEMGKLKCGHFYHIDCIKQWLVQKNCCPICKTSAASHG